MKLLSCILLSLFFTLQAFAEKEYIPQAEKVTANVYALIGPLGQRSTLNDGLNNNQGFIVTDKGVILIDSGASKISAEKIAQAVKKITAKKVKWVINTGSQDHRWLGNDFFASQGAEIIALERTAETQSQYADQQMKSMKRFLGKRLVGTNPAPATKTYKGNDVSLKLGGETLVLHYTDAHFPGDAWVWLPKQSVIFSGDLVYVDRVFAVLPWSSVRNGQKAYKEMEALKPKYIVPGHGRVSDTKRARKDCGDYYDFLANKIGKAAEEMESLPDVINHYDMHPDFIHLKNFNDLHRKNMSRAFLEYESAQ